MGEFHYIGTPALIARGESAVHAAVTAAAHDLVAQCQAACPVDTGTLRASIHVEGAGGGGGEGAVTGQITTGVSLVKGGASSGISTGGGGGGFSLTIATGGEASEYAIPVHEGSRPHWIEAKDANGFLFWPGAAHPVQRVFHPGAAPTKYIEGPLIANRPLYVLAVARASQAVF